MDPVIMRRTVIGSVAALVLAGGAWLVWSWATRSPDRTDLAYSTAGDGTLTLDLDYPSASETSYPVAIFLHYEGMWHRDLRRERRFRTIVQALTGGGYAVASVKVRAGEGAKFPDPLVDCSTAIRWLRANAPRYRLDPERFAAVGLSVGGYLACMIATQQEKDVFQATEHPEVSGRVQAVVAFGPLTDFAFAREQEIVPALVYLGWDTTKKPEMDAGRMSPFHRAAAGNAPCLLFHARKDPGMSVEHSRRYARKLKEVGVPCELVEVDSADHLWEGELFEESARKTVQFLDAHLKK